MEKAMRMFLMLCLGAMVLVEAQYVANTARFIVYRAYRPVIIKVPMIVNGEPTYFEVGSTTADAPAIE